MRSTAVWLLPLIATLTAVIQVDDLRFEDATVAAGIDFIHDNGVTAAKHLPETMGGGVAWTDYDGDGDQDLYLVQSGTLPGTERPGVQQPTNVLYRNRGDGTFEAASTGAEDHGYGMGATLADYDNDGWPDLYVTNYGANVLYRNNGDGTFSRQVGAGVEDARWSSSAAWGDLDGDGAPDLYVTNYVVYDTDTALSCGDEAAGVRSYCHIDLFEGLEDALLRNRGNGTFVDVAAEAGVANAAEGKGLGVVLGHLDGDDLTDIYVANDTQQNFLYLNRGNWRFEDQGLFSGTGYSDEGKAQAGMGTDMADLDGDGAPEILVTNFTFEPNNLYRRFAPGAYLDESFGLGLGEPGLALLAFGIVDVDADGDGDREVAVANGHILDTVEIVQDGVAYAQPNHLFRNLLTELRRDALARGDLRPGDESWRPAAGLFELAAAPGDGFDPVEVSRGLAVGDAEGDGRPDLMVTNNAGPARLLRNAGPVGHRLVLRLRGRSSNRDALGARVMVTPVGGDPAVDGAAGFPQHAQVRSASSYLSQGATDLYFGLGDSDRARVEIVWPDGSRQGLDELAAGNLVLLSEGREPVIRALPAPR